MLPIQCRMAGAGLGLGAHNGKRPVSYGAPPEADARPKISWI